MKKLPKLVFISSSQHFLDIFLGDFFDYISKRFEINLFTKFISKYKDFDQINRINIPINRKISPISDLFCLYQITRNIKNIKPDVIITLTPKSTIFGIFLKIINPYYYRVHIYTGFTWVNMKGFKRNLFKYLDRLNIKFSNKVLFDGQAQIDFLKHNNFNFNNFFLINNGSIKGVNTSLFFKYDQNKKNLIKKKFDVPINSKIILYIGRLDPDKGIKLLINSFVKLSSKFEDLILLIVGKDEMNINNYLENLNFKTNLINRIKIFPHSNNPIDIYNLADITCIPSTREGFGNVVIESSSCEVPVIGSNIFGLKNSLINNVNGFTFKVNDLNDLTSKISSLLKNEDLKSKFGKNGRKFVIENFEQVHVFKSLENLIIKN